MTLAMGVIPGRTTSTPLPNPSMECDACLYCNDTCDDEFCVSCQKKRNSASAQCRGPERSWITDALSIMCGETQRPDTYTMCQLRRHNRADSAWVLVGHTIYDVTSYVRNHPGGAEAILRKAGGAADCTEDLRFHSKRAQKVWKKNKVGTLCRCSCVREISLF